MAKDGEDRATPQTEAPYRVRLPGFTADADVGVGDAIKRMSAYVGIKPCGGCRKRAASLDRQVVFSRWRAR